MNPACPYENASGTRAPAQDPLTTCQTRALTDILDKLDFALILLDVGGRLVLANEVGHTLLAQSKVFRLIGERPMPVDTNQHHRWRAMLDGCARQRHQFGVFVGRGQATSVAVAHLKADEASPGRAQIVATFGRERAFDSYCLEGFAKAYRLSVAEVRVLTALANGRAPAAIAAAHGVSISTVRTQIKQLLGKTDCNSIRELLGQIARLPPMLGPGSVRPAGEQTHAAPVWGAPIAPADFTRHSALTPIKPVSAMLSPSGFPGTG